MKLPYFKKADILLAAVLLALGVGSLAFARSSEGGQVSVYVDGELKAALDLNQDKILEISTDYGTNTLEIQDGSARITASDCGGQDCIRMGSIAQGGELIVCLPHRLLVIIESPEAPDGVVY